MSFQSINVLSMRTAVRVMLLPQIINVAKRVALCLRANPKLYSPLS